MIAAITIYITGSLFNLKVKTNKNNTKSSALISIFLNVKSFFNTKSQNNFSPTEAIKAQEVGLKTYKIDFTILLSLNFK